MIRFFILFIVALLPLYGSKYNNTLLQMHARVLPSIVLMDRQIEEKVPNRVLKIAIIHKEEDIFDAQNFAKILLELDSSKIANFSVEPILLPIGSALPKDLIAIYMFPNSQIKTLAKDATKRKIVSFSYQIEGVEEGALASLIVGKQAVPYINLETVIKSEIIFNPALLTISKRFE